MGSTGIGTSINAVCSNANEYIVWQDKRESAVFTTIKSFDAVRGSLQLVSFLSEQIVKKAAHTR